MPGMQEKRQNGLVQDPWVRNREFLSKLCRLCDRREPQGLRQTQQYHIESICPGFPDGQDKGSHPDQGNRTRGICAQDGGIPKDDPPEKVTALLEKGTVRIQAENLPG